MTWLSCAVTAATAYTAGSYSPASEQLSEYWHVSQVATYVGITMLLARFFVGIGGSTFSTMVGGVISDLYHTQGQSNGIDHDGMRG